MTLTLISVKSTNPLTTILAGWQASPDNAVGILSGPDD